MLESAYVEALMATLRNRIKFGHDTTNATPAPAPAPAPPVQLTYVNSIDYTDLAAIYPSSTDTVVIAFNDLSKQVVTRYMYRPNSILRLMRRPWGILTVNGSTILDSGIQVTASSSISSTCP